MLKKIVIFLAPVLIAGFFYWQNLNAPANPGGQREVFLVNKGETIGEVAKNLEVNNLIKSAFYFKYIIWRRRFDIKAGKYAVSPSLTTKEIAKILTNGDALSQDQSITVIEGWSLKDMASYLTKNYPSASGNFLNLASARLDNWQFNFSRPDFLSDAPASASLEGYLFPDTYRLYQNATAAEMIFKMLSNFNKKLTEDLRAEIRRQQKTIYEVVTMASIIEKEVKTPEDMKIVSGIFWGRIKNQQALESCATLAYILGVNKKQYSLEDTKVNSLYNTYKYRGLPPGPIANPSLNAIRAAIYPVYTEYNYFLSDPKTSQTIYSKTLKEHNINKARYLR